MEIKPIAQLIAFVLFVAFVIQSLQESLDRVPNLQRDPLIFAIRLLGGVARFH